MYCVASESVLNNLKNDFKEKGLKQAEIANLLGYKTYQSVSIMLKSSHYLRPKQAKILAEKFGYRYDYLTKGEGTLFTNDEKNIPEINGDVQTRKLAFDNAILKAILIKFDNPLINKIINELEELDKLLVDKNAQDLIDTDEKLTFLFEITKQKINKTVEEIKTVQ